MIKHTRLLLKKSALLLIYLFTFSLLFPPPVMASKSFLTDIIENENQSFDSKAVQLDYQVIEESVLAKEQHQGRSFRVLTRKKEIARYKCSSCHTDKPITARNGLQLTHGDVAINHGQNQQLQLCIDCHHPEERDFLEDKKGKKIDFDHSYQLCGQCHFRQKRDWIGGAHGKRVSNWAGERVVYNCTTCHNPHSPLFKKRYPATYSVPLD